MLQRANAAEPSSRQTSSLSRGLHKNVLVGLCVVGLSPGRPPAETPASHLAMGDTVFLTKNDSKQ